jgi:hypothetical protein
MSPDDERRPIGAADLRKQKVHYTFDLSSNTAKAFGANTQPAMRPSTTADSLR